MHTSLPSVASGLRSPAPRRLALGSPGGSTIITTVTQVVAHRNARDLSLPDAVEEPRASQRNTADVTAEPAFIEQYGPALEALGHTFTETEEIGAVTAIEHLDRRRLQAVAEAERRGGGDAGVVGRRGRRGRR